MATLQLESPAFGSTFISIFDQTMVWLVGERNFFKVNF